MAYRIDPTAPTPTELRRVLREQLDAAATALREHDPVDGDVLHDVRTNVKKARAALRLARGDVGRGVASHANDELRQVNRSLAEARDADAVLECLDRLHAAAEDDVERDAVTAVRGAVAGRRTAAEALTRSRARGAAATLERTAEWLERVPSHSDGWSALAVGFEREYRRGWRAYLGLHDESTAEDLHAWRRRVKDLWYHQRLLRELWPEAQKPIRSAAKELASSLGDDHDLAGLRIVLDDPHLPVTSESRDLVRSLADAERFRLGVEVRDLGALLYADDPEAWVARHGAWWAHRRSELACVGDPRPD